jgi:hypothetical protein
MSFPRSNTGTSNTKTKNLFKNKNEKKIASGAYSYVNKRARRTGSFKKHRLNARDW